MPYRHPLRVAIAEDGRYSYEIAAAARINPSSLSKIIAGRMQPTEAVKQRIAAALGRSEDELFLAGVTAEKVAASRAACGLGPTVTDPEALAAVGRALGYGNESRRAS